MYVKLQVRKNALHTCLLYLTKYKVHARLIIATLNCCRHDQYGGEIEGGYCYYDTPRPYVKASRSVFICRDLYCNLAAAA